MGEVYLAEDTRSDRKVAVKFISAANGAKGHSQRRFVREARAAAKLGHPNICAFHEVGEAAGHHFIVMQYIEGTTLAERISNGARIEPAEALSIGIQVTSALVAAHSEGVIHRDIKPQNIMLTPSNEVKVLDFGLAKVVSDIPSEQVAFANTQSLVTEQGMLVGTVPYMSPEQLHAEPLEPRSDIFSCGVILYEILSGRNPFARETPVATLSAILTHEPPSLIETHEDIPVELDRIVSKCLAKQPEQRYQSAQALLDDLSSLDPASAATVKVLPKHRTSVSRRFRPLAILAGLLLVLAAVSYFRPWQRWTKQVTAASETKDGQSRQGRSITSIAVAPFEVDQNNSELDSISKGFAQSITNSLSLLPGMKVLGPNAFARYTEKVFDPAAVGRNFNVETLLRGRFVQQDDSFKVDVELLDTKDNSVLWSQTFLRQSSGLLIMQAEAAYQLNNWLRVNLSGDDKKRWANQHTEYPEAYKLYLKGRNLWSKRTPEDMTNSIGFFNQAIDIDPTYAVAYVGLADAYSSLSAGLQVLPPKEAMPKAEAAARKAISLDENLAEAHTSLAVVEMMYAWNWTSADQEFQRALALDPNSPTTHNWYSLFLIVTGRLDDAVAESRRAQELDPLALFVEVNRARTLYFSRQYDEVIKVCNQIISTSPKFYVSHYFLGLAYAKKGMHAKAIEEIKTVISLNGDNPLWTSVLGYVYANAGRTTEALQAINKLHAQAQQQYISPIDFVYIYAGLGDREQAFQWLERAYEERVGVLIYLHVEPVYEVLKDDARFADLLQRLGLKLESRTSRR